MYLEYYGLKQEPFHITPDPEFLYLSPSHKEALDSITKGVERRKGLVVLIGEAGVGKTTIVRSFMEQIDRSRIKTVVVFNANVSFENLMKIFHAELGLAGATDDANAMLQHLHSFLVEEYNQGCNVVLIVDEAQNMPAKTLESLRLLSNLETSQNKLLQILLIGQPELGVILDSEGLKLLRQRLAVRTRLSPLTASESLAYMLHRLSLVKVDERPVFSKQALKQVIKYSQGIPRKINILCDNALIAGYARQRRPVPAVAVKDAIVDLEGTVRKRSFRWVAVSAILAVLCVGLLWGFRYGKPTLSRLVHSELAPALDSLLQKFGSYSRQVRKTSKAALPSSPTQLQEPNPDPGDARSVPPLAPVLKKQTPQYPAKSPLKSAYMGGLSTNPRATEEPAPAGELPPEEGQIAPGVSISDKGTEAVQGSDSKLKQDILRGSSPDETARTALEKPAMKASRDTTPPSQQQAGAKGTDSTPITGQAAKTPENAVPDTASGRDSAPVEQQQPDPADLVEWLLQKRSRRSF